jgi:hypothetical protein
MKDRDKNRFRENISWFNQFFDGMRQIYELTVNLLPVEFFQEGFSLKRGNFFFPRYKIAPSMPPYYAMMVEGRQFALQLVAVVDDALFAAGGPFIVEPSLVVMLHTQIAKFGWLSDYALRVIKNQQLTQSDKVGNSIKGKIEASYPADFFAFQVQYDKFSDNRSLQSMVSQYIVEPILQNLERGFQSS